MQYEAIRVFARAFILFFLVFSMKMVCEEKSITLVITSYNNAQWYKKNLDAAFSQNYLNYKIIYVDDASPDGTGDLVEAYIKERGQEDRVILVRNKERMFKMYNFYHAVHDYCDDDDIVFDYDGDDWFACNDALSIVNEAYQNANVWLTYGSYRAHPGGQRGMGARAIPLEVVESRSYRDYDWVTSHLKTFYAWLFKMIPVEAFKYKGEFIRAANDIAFMFPMLEIIDGRFKFIEDILYVYNIESPINNQKIMRPYQKEMDRYTRKERKRYICHWNEEKGESAFQKDVGYVLEEY